MQKNNTMRQNDAKQYRHIRRILRGQEPEPEIDLAPKWSRSKWFLNISILILSIVTVLLLLQGCAHAYTNDQYVNAIYMAEGGLNARFPYGIRSIKCKGLQNCRNTCLKTVRHNRIRFKKYGYKKYPRFIEFLQSRYCPTKGGNLSQSEIRLNQYWINNVRWFLNHPKS